MLLSAPLQTLVSPAWLHENLRTVTLIDATWFVPKAQPPGMPKPTPAASFAAMRIPSAKLLDIDAANACDNRSPLPHMLPSTRKFARLAGRLGISARDDRPVVVYARAPAPFVAAARVWWMLRAFGLPDARIAVVDGGLPAWQAAQFEVDVSPPSPEAMVAAVDGGVGDEANGDDDDDDATAVAAAAEGVDGFRLRTDLVADSAAVMAHIKRGSATLVDARNAGRFFARESEPRAGLRSGHMPGALNVPVSSVTDAATGALLPRKQLARVFAAAGLDLDAVRSGDAPRVVTTCGSGVTASVVALALHVCGVSDAAVYDGSWSEYGALEHAPIVGDSPERGRK